LEKAEKILRRDALSIILRSDNTRDEASLGQCREKKKYRVYFAADSIIDFAEDLFERKEW
jgi:hypothetical protein